MADQIGKGFSAKVYKGIHEETQETVAIKVIDLKSLKDRVGVTMLQSEIEVLKDLSHPNILKLHNVYSTVNNCYIVTEYCGKGDLASLLKQRRRLPEN
jgi:serine/threonine-protein kinase ULK/ATG1